MIDVLLTGSRVFGREHADSVALRRGQVYSVGTFGDLQGLVTSATKVVHTEGRLIMPGFQDAHVHPLAAGLLESLCDLRDAVDAADSLTRIRAYAARNPDLPWIVGGGWTSAFFPGRSPTAELLDTAVSDRPAYLMGSDMHDAWVNTAALTCAGVGAHTPDPPHGTIARDRRGNPIGTLHEAAAELVGRQVPPLDEAILATALRVAQRTLHRYGITAWQDALVGPYLGLPDPLPAYLALGRQGNLTGRISLALWWDPGRGLEQLEELCERRELARGANLRADHAKIMQDGICENGWAALLTPYLHRSASRPSRLDADRLRKTVMALDRAGFSAHFHAVGDRAVRECLDAVQAARHSSDQGRRHHIAHVQLVADEDLPRFAELDVTATVQPLWAAEIPQMRKTYEPMLGAARVDRQYPFGSLLRAGARLAAGSDWPVSSPNPLWGAYVAVTRLPALASAPWLGPDYRAIPLNTSEGIGVSDILHSYTEGTAHLHKYPATLTAFSPADIVVLDRDVVQADPSSLGEAHVDLTFVGGRCVYDRHGEWQ